MSFPGGLKRSLLLALGWGQEPRPRRRRPASARRQPSHSCAPAPMFPPANRQRRARAAANVGEGGPAGEPGGSTPRQGRGGAQRGRGAPTSAASPLRSSTPAPQAQETAHPDPPHLNATAANKTCVSCGEGTWWSADVARKSAPEGTGKLSRPPHRGFTISNSSSQKGEIIDFTERRLRVSRGTSR